MCFFSFHEKITQHNNTTIPSTFTTTTKMSEDSSISSPSSSTTNNRKCVPINGILGTGTITSNFLVLLLFFEFVISVISLIAGGYYMIQSNAIPPSTPCTMLTHFISAGKYSNCTNSTKLYNCSTPCVCFIKWNIWV